LVDLDQAPALDLRCHALGQQPEPEDERTLGAETGLSSQRTHFSRIRGCVWTCSLACNSDGVTRWSPDHHHTRHAHDAARRRAEVWDRAPSGAAKRANRTAPRTPHRTHKAAPRAAHRTRRATGRARRHHTCPRHHRAEKVIGSFRANNGDRPASARAAKAVQRAASAGLQDTGQAAPTHIPGVSVAALGGRRMACSAPIHNLPKSFGN
jgi:hypothetical protein